MVAALPSSARLESLRQFARFGTVGFAGFLVDNAVVYGLRSATGLYVAGVLAYVAAATLNWALNRAWTFRSAAPAAAHRQWALFLAANAVGFVLNRGTYAGLIAVSDLCRTYPVLAVSAGTLAGMGANFHLSRTLVFKAPEARNG